MSTTFPPLYIPGPAACVSCKWWLYKARMGTPGQEFDLGECRKNGPTLIERKDGRLWTKWPTTKGTDFCGQYGLRIVPSSGQESQSAATASGHGDSTRAARVRDLLTIPTLSPEDAARIARTLAETTGTPRRTEAVGQPVTGSAGPVAAPVMTHTPTGSTAAPQPPAPGSADWPAAPSTPLPGGLPAPASQGGHSASAPAPLESPLAEHPSR